MKKIVILLFVFVPYYLFAQHAPIKWKDIPIENLKMTSYELDLEASAVILCDFGQMYFDINPNGQHLFLFYDRHVRIKILKEEGKKYAKIQVPFHDLRCEMFQRENSIILDARVYNLDKNGKVITRKIKKKNITYRDSTDCTRIAEITIPDVKVGSVIEYKYKIPTLDLIFPRSWYFQNDIPTVHSEFRFRFPKDFQYLVSSVNINYFDVNEEDYYNKSIFVNRSVIDLSGKSYQFVKKNIPAFNCKYLIKLPNDYKQKLNIHLVNIRKNTSNQGWKHLTRSLMITIDEYYEQKTPEERRMMNYPLGFIIYQLPSWKELNDDLLKSKRFGLPLIMYWDNKTSLDSIINNINNPHEKMLAIYDYIRKNIKWNGQYDIYTRRVFSPLAGKVYSKITNKVINEKSLRHPFENKTGTSSEINFILIYLLNKAGIEAHPILLSTHKNGKIDRNIPDAAQFNHVIASVNINGQQLFLDATDSLRPHHLLKQNSIGTEGLLVKKKGGGWIEIKNTVKDSLLVYSNLTIDSNLNISGNIKKEITGYNALNLRKKIRLNSSTEFETNEIQKIFSDYEIVNVEVERLYNESNPLLIRVKFNKSNASKNNEVITIKPMLFSKYNEDYFPDVLRICPIEFEYPFLKEYELNIKIPDSYKVEAPKNIQYEVYGKNALFTYQILKLKGSIVQLKISFELKTNEFPAHEYRNLSEFFKNVTEKLNEEIIIKKEK